MPSELEKRQKEVNELELQLFGSPCEEQLDYANLNIVNSLQSKAIGDVDFEAPELSDIELQENETLTLHSLDIEVDCTKGRNK